MKIWFLERQTDGRIEQMMERQAYETLNNPNRRHQWKILGVCEGRMWGVDVEQMCPLGNEQIKVLEEGMKDIQMVDPRLSELEGRQQKYYQAIEDLVYKDFADPETDERVKRGRAMLDKVNVEVEEIKSKPHPFGELNKKARDIQLSLCRGNIIRPSKRSLVSGDADAIELMMKTRTESSL